MISRNTSLKDGVVVHSLARFMSGLVSSAISTPIDVVKSRIMDSPEAYKGSLDCVAKTFRREGLCPHWQDRAPSQTGLAISISGWIRAPLRL